MKKKTKNKRKTAFRKSVTGITKTMSRRADRVADIILDKSIEDKGAKTKEIAGETVSMVKEVAKQIRKNLKTVKARDFLSDAAYGLGKAAGAVSKLSREFRRT
ncbi:MAG: hypothetical protein HQL30_12680 [Candidatus Omnitrophica bacterium]|nr:hypothetical protein [Candidatus Omnitrophota bacterium]